MSVTPMTPMTLYDLERTQTHLALMRQRLGAQLMRKAAWLRLFARNGGTCGRREEVVCQAGCFASSLA